MTELPKISIIISNYNYGRFLSAAVESALLQTYGRCEVIVVDDGSTDESRSVLQRFENRAKIILQENQGQAAAFNRGFQLASGDLVAFLDSDDMLFPEAMQTAVEAWQPGIVKIQSPLEILAVTGPTGVHMPSMKLSEGNLLHQLLETGRYVAAPTSGNVFSRSFLSGIFPIPAEEWAQTADGYMNTCAPFYGRIVALRRPIGYYRVHGKSMSSATPAGAVDLAQLEKLMRHAMLEKTLIEKLAEKRGLYVSRRAVVSNWMNLKLRLSLQRLKNPARIHRLRLLTQCSASIVSSVFRARELSLLRKLQHITWAVAVTVLPTAPAEKLILYAFDHAPQSRFLRMMRRT